MNGLYYVRVFELRCCFQSNHLKPERIKIYALSGLYVFSLDTNLSENIKTRLAPDNKFAYATGRIFTLFEFKVSITHPRDVSVFLYRDGLDGVM